VAGVPALTVMVMGELVAVVGDAQGAVDVMITRTTSLLFKPEVVKTLLLVPTLLPFTCH
jgi:hypothetical protein